MGVTKKADVGFVPKVWNDHVNAYFDTKLGIGQLALIDKTLTAEKGETVNFPYWKAIGGMQEPTEDEGLEVDKLVDDAFSVTVKEVGKAVGWKDAANRKSAAGKEKAETEAQRQMAQRYAEKVESDLIITMNTPGAFTDGYIATAANDKMTVANLLESSIVGFGDKSENAVAIAMHSIDYLNMMKDGTAGFLKADANDPFFNAPGFMGRILGKALFVLDSMPQVSGGIGGQKAYQHFIFKPNPFGIYIAEEGNYEKDRDILARENIVAMTAWYGTLSLHGKVSADDKRVVRGAFASGKSL